MIKAAELINKFYIIKCFNGFESFIKVGTTGTSLSRRYSGKKMPYSWEIISEVECNYLHSLKLENLVSDNFESYDPEIKFGGYLECFKCDDIKLIISLVSDYFLSIKKEA